MSVDFGASAAHAPTNCFPQDVVNFAASESGSRCATTARSSAARSVSNYAYAQGVDGSVVRSKLKRSRQRVDAGEPRNTYSSIFCYSSMGADAMFGNVEPSKVRSNKITALCDLEGNNQAFKKELPSSSPAPPSASDAGHDNVTKFTPTDSTETVAMETNGLQKYPSVDGRNEFDSNCATNVLTPTTTNNCDSAEQVDEAHQQLQKKARVESIISCIQGSSPCLAPSSEASCSPSLSDISPQQSMLNSAIDMTKSRRKRYQPQQLEVSEEQEAVHDTVASNDDFTDDLSDEDDRLDDDDESDEKLLHPTAAQRQIIENDEHPLKQMHKDLFLLQRKYIETLHEQQKKTICSGKAMTNASDTKSPKVTADVGQAEMHSPILAEALSSMPGEVYLAGKELAPMIEMLKSELMSSFSKVVDRSLQKYCQSLRAAVVDASTTQAASAPSSLNYGIRMSPAVLESRMNCAGMLMGEPMPALAPHLRSFYCPPPPPPPPPVGYGSLATVNNQGAPFGLGSPMGIYFPGRANGMPATAADHQLAASSIYPQSCLTFHHGGSAAGVPSAALANVGPFKAPNGGRPSLLNSMVPRKRRNKVTDTRVNRINVMQLAVDDPAAAAHRPASGYLPSMVAQGGGCDCDVEGDPLTSPDTCNTELGSPGKYDSQHGQNSTLTPMHLRKAKLMFFYTRYPSSVLLKTYFPDIKFNKNNTAQLVKWFSNFREFYYIQMEKYSRQAISEGIRSAEDIHVSTDSELYKVLNLHYNRNNHVMAPNSFRRVVEATLHQFFNAIQSGRDAEPSWKKSIYKVIARMDDAIPDYFKTPNFLETLE